MTAQSSTEYVIGGLKDSKELAEVKAADPEVKIPLVTIAEMGRAKKGTAEAGNGSFARSAVRRHSQLQCQGHQGSAGIGRALACHLENCGVPHVPWGPTPLRALKLTTVSIPLGDLLPTDIAIANLSPGTHSPRT